MVALADKVLSRPKDYKNLGPAGVEMVKKRYSLEVCLPQMLAALPVGHRRAQGHGRLTSGAPPRP